ncbi:MAG: hypothetical protein HKL80_06405 [Acidimicrobiales bacterium]|nr:hypothetical protein [Acidimicrobiales bacterium]
MNESTNHFSKSYPKLIALGVLFLYLILSICIWHRVWIKGPTTWIVNTTGDPSQNVWFIGWFAHSISTLNFSATLHSKAMFAPNGVSLLANPAIQFPSLVLTPFTLLFGPVFSFNLAVTLAPVLNGFFCYLMCRHFNIGFLGSGVAGFVFGFGPFVSVDLHYGHLHVTWLWLIPLLVIIFDEIFRKQSRNYILNSLYLTLLLIAQFFTSLEFLAIFALMSLFAAFIWAVLNLSRLGSWTRTKGAYCVKSLVLAALLSIVILSYPTWQFVFGPTHLNGEIWPNIGKISTSLKSFIFPHGESAGVRFVSGGNGDFLGPGTLFVLIAGTFVFRKLKVVLLLASLLVVAVVFSMGSSIHFGHLSIPMPDAILTHLPGLYDIFPSRFGAVIDLVCAGLVAVVIEQLLVAKSRSEETEVSKTARLHSKKSTDTAGARRWIGVGAVIVLVIPMVMANQWPYKASNAGTPNGLDNITHVLPPNSSIAFYAVPSGEEAPSMIWQAEDNFSFNIYGGYALIPGPSGRATESLPLNTFTFLLSAASLGVLSTTLTPVDARNLQHTIASQNIDAVVLTVNSKNYLTLRKDFALALGPPILATKDIVAFRS